MRNKIAIIGANEQQNPLILKAQELGFETHVFAWQTGGEIGERTADYFYPISTENKEDILEKCRELGVCAIASIGSDIAALSCAYVAEKLTLTCNTYASVIYATNKLMTRSLFSKCGIPQPAYVEIGDALPYDTLASLRYPLVVKPSDRSGGRGLAKVFSESQLYRAISTARDLSFERRAIVEEYVLGQLFSCECISWNGHHKILNITRRGVAEIDGTICETEHEQPAILPLSIVKQLEELCPAALNTLGLRCGASSVEFIMTGNHDLIAIEVTPSMYGDYIGSHLIPVSTGCDYLRMVLEIACGKEPNLKTSDNIQPAYVRFLYSDEDMAALNMFRTVVPERLIAWGMTSGTSASTAAIRRGYYIVRSPYRQFGGCPPLRTSFGKPYYNPRESSDVLALDSEYTAFWYALRRIGAKRIHLPYYASSVWTRIAQNLQIATCFYHINLNYLPADLSQSEGDAVLLVNYHSACDAYIREYSACHNRVIIDNSMAFFTPPLLLPGVYNIYSCRKFFAVSDGAYLISESLASGELFPLEQDVSYKRARALLLSLELGEGAAYKELQSNEQELVENRRTMSVLTETLLASIPYEDERTRRRANYDRLDDWLGQFQISPISIGAAAAPQFYPLLVNAEVRALLVLKKIFIPLMWRGLLGQQYNGTVEQRLSQKLLCLPVDQRYSIKDMDYLAEVVLSILS